MPGDPIDDGDDGDADPAEEFFTLDGADDDLIDLVTDYTESSASVERVEERQEYGITVLTARDGSGSAIREIALIESNTDAITGVLDDMHAGKCTLVVTDGDDVPPWLSDSIDVWTTAELREHVHGAQDDTDDTEVDVDDRRLSGGEDPAEVDPDIDPESVTLTGSTDSTVQAELLTDQEDVEGAADDVETVDLSDELQPVMDGEPENGGTVTNVVALHCRVVRVDRGGNKYDTYANVVVADYSGAATIRVHDEDTIDAFDGQVGDEVLVTAVGDSRERRGVEYITTDATGVIELQSDDYPAGYYLDAPSPLEDVGSMYALAETKAEAWSEIADAVLEEYQVKVPYGSEKAWLYVADQSRADYGVWVPDGLERLETVLDDHLPSKDNKSHDRREILKNVKNRARVEADAFAEGVPDDADLKWMVGVENGVIDLKTGELHDHAPHWRLRSKLPTEYKPGEYDGLGDGIDWFLDDVCRDEEDRRMCIAMAAHSLMRHHNIKSSFPILGPADTGKTKWHGIVKRLVGYDNVATINFDSFAAGEGFETGKIMNAHAVLDDDASGKKINDLNYLKKVTGGEEVSVNRKYEKLADFQPYATVSWLSNDPAVLGERNSGVKSRLYPIVMPHRHTEDEDDGHKMAIDAAELEDRIYAEEEIEALLVAAVEKAQEMADTGKPGSERTETERWELYHWYSDASLRFQRDHLQAKTGAKMKKQAVYEVYSAMCQQDGIEPMAESQFWTSMRKSAEISFEGGSWIGDKRAVEHIMLSEEAVKIAPEWVVEEYESEIETGIKTNPLDRVAPIEDLNFGPLGPVEGRVIGRRHLQGDGGSGVLVRIQDDSGRLDVIAWDDDGVENELAGVRVGDKIRTDNGTLLRNDKGSQQLQIGDFGSVDIVELGPNHSGDQQGLPDADDDDGDDDGDEVVNGSSDDGTTADTDVESPGASEGGQESQDGVMADGGDTEGDGLSIDADVQRDRVRGLRDIIESVEHEHDEGAPLAEVRERAVEAGLSEDKFDHELMKLKKQGKVYEPAEDRLRAV
ncbi:phage/plasmid primase, P4 family [Halorussus aquaticus]|uniref:Phage/plasmid primase, P4 family n=1 Tax=Halorussus aquaticus TaxID=2953748 RepID=A0ABD5Q3A3_9EURY|nr:phage/plasmid primase, P4 family [Halorussus aquaticus]